MLPKKKLYNIQWNFRSALVLLWWLILVTNQKFISVMFLMWCRYSLHIWCSNLWRHGPGNSWFDHVYVYFFINFSMPLDPGIILNSHCISCPHPHGPIYPETWCFFRAVFKPFVLKILKSLLCPFYVCFKPWTFWVQIF